MRIDSYTKIGEFCIPVVNAKFSTIVQFSSGEHGRKEAGDFCFWTLQTKRKIGGRKRHVTGRASVFYPPGERFCRTEREAKGKRAATVYDWLWNGIMDCGANVEYIRPSTKREVMKWMKSHGSDSKFAYRIFIGGEVFSLSWK